MTYAELRAAILERRFPSNSPVSSWLEAAYDDVWNATEWEFKRVSGATWYTTADGLSNGTPAQQPKMLVDFANPLALYDDLGNPLVQLPQREFEKTYQPYIVSDRPEAFMVVNRQIWLGPKPNAAYPFKLSYKRRISTRTTTGAVQAGFFVQDTDIPLWDDHHYLLVLRAKMIGLRDRSDPTASDLENEFARLLAAMKDEYVEQGVLGRQLPAWR